MQWRVTSLESLKQCVQQIESCKTPCKFSSSSSTEFYTHLLRQCILHKSRALDLGRRIHHQMTKTGHDRGTYLGNLLLHMYVACSGSVDDICTAFLCIQSPDTFSYNMKMAGYAHNAQIDLTKKTFIDFPTGRNVVTWTILMTAYAQTGHLLQASNTFKRMPQWTAVSQTAMVKLQAELRNLVYAREVFDRMPERNCVTWNTMIVAYARSGRVKDAVKLHERAPGWDLVSWTTLLAAHAERFDVENARKMFDGIMFRSEAPWNAMIKAYAETRRLSEAELMFERIPMRDVITCTSMVDAYVLAGDLQAAREVFDAMPEKNSVSFGVMISAYARDESEESLSLFLRMDLEGIPVEEMTFVAVLDACGSSAAIIPGRIIHGSIRERGLEQDLRIGSALVNMYGKCGRVETAREIFEKVPVQDVILWTSLIVSFAHNGLTEAAVGVFGEMQMHGFAPDTVTFVSVLSACSHSGLRADAWLRLLGMIWDDYGLELSHAHYLCVLDVLGRAGELEHVEAVINSMPYEPGIVAWTTLLSSSKEIGDHSYACRAVQQIQALDPSQGAPYTLLPNMLALL